MTKRNSFFKTASLKSTSRHPIVKNIEPNDDISTTRGQSAYSQILHLSIEQYTRGQDFLQRKELDKAKECFEDALAARLVLYGPDSDEVMESHHQLRLIAREQGDSRKEAHHKAKIMQIQSTKFRQKYRHAVADRIDWRVLHGD